jgi:hypothetical protein
MKTLLEVMSRCIQVTRPRYDVKITQMTNAIQSALQLLSQCKYSYLGDPYTCPVLMRVRHRQAASAQSKIELTFITDLWKISQ